MAHSNFIMNSDSSSSPCTSRPAEWLPPLAWGLGVGVAGVAATLLLALVPMPLPLRAFVALLPLVPSFGYLGCVVRLFRRVDEMQRRIQLESLGFAFPATAILVMGADLLQQARVVPAFHWNWGVFIAVMCLLWLAGYVLAARRYR